MELRLIIALSARCLYALLIKFSGCLELIETFLKVI